MSFAAKLSPLIITFLHDITTKIIQFIINTVNYFSAKVSTPPLLSLSSREHHYAKHWCTA